MGTWVINRHWPAELEALAYFARDEMASKGKQNLDSHRA